MRVNNACYLSLGRIEMTTNSLIDISPMVCNGENMVEFSLVKEALVAVIIHSPTNAQRKLVSEAGDDVYLTSLFVTNKYKVHRPSGY